MSEARKTPTLHQIPAKIFYHQSRNRSFPPIQTQDPNLQSLPKKTQLRKPLLQWNSRWNSHSPVSYQKTHFKNCFFSELHTEITTLARKKPLISLSSPQNPTAPTSHYKTYLKDHNLQDSDLSQKDDRKENRFLRIRTERNTFGRLKTDLEKQNPARKVTYLLSKCAGDDQNDLYRIECRKINIQGIELNAGRQNI